MIQIKEEFLQVCCPGFMSMSYFENWRFDRRTGRIEGIGPLNALGLPEEYWCLVSDPCGRLLELREHRADWAAPAVKVLGYEGDHDGPILEALDYNSDGSLRLIHDYFYDPRGRMSRRLEFDGEGNPRGWVESFWNDRDLEIEEAVYDRAGCLKARHHYEYDDFGQLAEEQIFTGNGLLEGVRRWLYDDRQRIREKLWINAAGRLKSRLVHRYEPERTELVRITSGS